VFPNSPRYFARYPIQNLSVSVLKMKDPARAHSDPDPRFLSIMAWNLRWSARNKSCALAEQAVSLSPPDSPTNKVTAACALRTLAWQAKWRGDFDTTATLCMRAKRLATKAPAPYILADVLSLLGVVHYSAGRRDIASTMVARGLDLLDPHAPAETHVDLLVTRSTILRYRGRLPEAHAVLAEAMEHAIGPEAARVAHNRARLLNHESAFAEAAVLADGALDTAKAFDAAVLLPYVYEVLGTAQTALGEPEKARQTLDMGLKAAQSGKDLRAQCQILNQVGIAARACGDTENAALALSAGVSLATKMGYSLWKRSFLVALGELHDDAGNYREAMEAYKAALELQEKVRD
jgi:tetratricopeptide (TPR) repeat protein